MKYFPATPFLEVDKLNKKERRPRQLVNGELTPVTCEDLALSCSVPTRCALLEMLPYSFGLVVLLSSGHATVLSAYGMVICTVPGADGTSVGAVTTTT